MLASIHSFTPQFQHRPNIQHDAARLQPSEARAQPNRSLASNMTPKAVSAAPAVTNEPLSADRAAGNILLFIENQLKLDAANGDSQEQLQSRFEAGLKGFLQGFNEAKTQLSDMGLLSDALASDIGTTFSKVTEGLKQLANELGLDAGAVPSAPQHQPLPQTQTTRVDTQRLESSLAVGDTRLGIIKAHKNFDFTVQTQEGDRVKISASSHFSAKYAEAGQGSASSVGQKQQFSLHIEGDLNADELAAINDLLSQVNDLADQFYEGDLDAAFDAALNLGFDADEIASFAVDLKYSVTQKVRTTYGQPSNEVSPLRNQLQPFAQLRDQVQSALDSARQFLDPTALLDALLATRLETKESLSPVEGGMGNLHKLFGDVNHALAEKLALL